MQCGQPLTRNLCHKRGNNWAAVEPRPLITAQTGTLIQVVLLTNGLSHGTAHSKAQPHLHQGQEVTSACLKAATPTPPTTSSACIGMKCKHTWTQMEVHVRRFFPQGHGDIVSWLFVWRIEPAAICFQDSRNPGPTHLLRGNECPTGSAQIAQYKNNCCF